MRRLFLECHADEALARRLGWTRRQLQHFTGKGEVCNRLAKCHGMLALVDDDPRAVPSRYLRALPTESDVHDVRCVRDAERGHRIVIVCPRIEEWVLTTARYAKVSIEEYRLVPRGNALHRDALLDLGKWTALLDALLAKESARIARLRSLLQPR